MISTIRSCLGLWIKWNTGLWDLQPGCWMRFRITIRPESARGQRARLQITRNTTVSHWVRYFVETLSSTLMEWKMSLGLVLSPPHQLYKLPSNTPAACAQASHRSHRKYTAILKANRCVKEWQGFSACTNLDCFIRIRHTNIQPWWTIMTCKSLFSNCSLHRGENVLTSPTWLS